MISKTYKIRRVEMEQQKKTHFHSKRTIINRPWQRQLLQREHPESREKRERHQLGIRKE
jgi:hypothetical protein